MRKLLKTLMAVLISVLLGLYSTACQRAMVSTIDGEVNHSPTGTETESYMSMDEIESDGNDADGMGQGGGYARYGMSNGQWGILARYDYNAAGQLLAVTAISPYSQAPLYQERYKMDRIYTYGEDGKLCHIWLNYHLNADLTYAADGHSATGVATFDGDTVEVAVMFNDRNMIVEETYVTSTGTNTFSYDENGRVTTLLLETDFATYHRYDGNRVNIQTLNSAGEPLFTFTMVLDDDGRILQLGDDEPDMPTLVYTYDSEGQCTQSVQTGCTYRITYDEAGRITACDMEQDSKLLNETFAYDAEGNMTVFRRRVRQNGTYFQDVEDVVTFTYDENGMMTKGVWEDAEYDSNGNELYRRITEI